LKYDNVAFVRWPSEKGTDLLNCSNLELNNKSVPFFPKLYESRSLSDSTRGFSRKRDTFVHYKLVGGVYELQQTAAEQVQAWLNAKNLTWQAGFPSKSECPGQEGQLIPEMHDPLLNDPDVLH
jgi:hypothetical protein